MEIDVDRLQPITRPTQFDKIILPDESYRFSFSKSFPSFFTAYYREMIDRIRDFAIKNQTPTSKKIYYFYGRGQIGEERLAEYFKSKGYEIVLPEKLTLDEQINLLINCESFATNCGSISHNSLFLRDNTETIFLTRTVNGFTGCQPMLDQVHPINANYVDSVLSIFAKIVPKVNCFIISEQLKRFFGDKWSGYDDEDFKTFLQYIKNSLSQGYIVNPNTMKYYAPVLEDFMEQLKQREDLIAAYDMPPKWEEFRPVLTYQTHVTKSGWGAFKREEQISNYIKQQLDIQAIKINFPTHKVFYSVYYNDAEGWSEEVSNGEMSGTTGKSKPITGIKIRLDEAGTKEFDILYRLHKFDGEWTAWAKNGEVIYSHGQKLNAIQIKLEHRRT